MRPSYLSFLSSETGLGANHWRQRDVEGRPPCVGQQGGAVAGHTLCRALRGCPRPRLGETSESAVGGRPLCVGSPGTYPVFLSEGEEIWPRGQGRPVGLQVSKREAAPWLVLWSTDVAKSPAPSVSATQPHSCASLDGRPASCQGLFSEQLTRTMLAPGGRGSNGDDVWPLLWSEELAARATKGAGVRSAGGEASGTLLRCCCNTH